MAAQIASVPRSDGLLERMSTALMVNSGESTLLRAAAARWLAAAAAHETWCARLGYAASRGALPARAAAASRGVAALVTADEAVLDAGERYERAGGRLALRELLRRYEESTRERLDHILTLATS